MVQTTGRAAYLACRDLLVRHRDDYDAAIAAFRSPEIGDRFGRGTGPRANHFGCAQDLHRRNGGMGPGSATADAIFAHVHRNLPPYQRIRRIEFENVPKSISGKIPRIDLRVRENPCEADGLTLEYHHR